MANKTNKQNNKTAPSTFLYSNLFQSSPPISNQTLQDLGGDVTRLISQYLENEDFKNFRLTCTFFKEHTYNDLVDRINRTNKIIQVALNFGRTLLLTEQGKVLQHGNLTSSGKFAYSDMDNTNYKTLDSVSNVRQIAVTPHDCLSSEAPYFFLLKDGTVLASKTQWEEGIRPDEKLIPIPNLTEVAYITSSKTHCFFLINDGTVRYCVADIGRFLLGYHHELISIPNLHDVTQITGSEHTLFLKKDGTLWGHGNNFHGQLGLDDPFHLYVPTPIPNVRDISQVAVGDNHTLLLKNDGTVLVCGANFYGQLGLEHNLDIHYPTVIPYLTNVCKVVAGSDHSIFLKNDGSVWVCGKNNYGQLGLGDNLHRNRACQIPHLNNVKEIAAYDCSSIFSTDEDKVFSCGANHNGQLGPVNYNSFQTAVNEIPNLNKIHQVGINHDHTAILTKDGKVCLMGGSYIYDKYKHYACTFRKEPVFLKLSTKIIEEPSQDKIIKRLTQC